MKFGKREAPPLPYMDVKTMRASVYPYRDFGKKDYEHYTKRRTAFEGVLKL